MTLNVTCKDYLKSSSTISNLTIIDSIETPTLQLASGSLNIFFTSEWNLTKPFMIKKGYVPLLRRYYDSKAMVSNIIDPNYSDYLCLNGKNIQTNERIIFNISRLYYLHTDNKIYNNFLINFVFNNPNQTYLSNYTFNYSYNLFGSFPVNVYTLFGGILLTPSNKYINIQRIQTYPFKVIQMNKFELNCSLANLRLDCFLRVNLSNYADSFQQITIDYGDGIRFDSFRLNPYCKYKL